jgi:glutamine synthetase
VHRRSRRGRRSNVTARSPGIREENIARQGLVCQAAPELEAYLLGPEGQLLEVGMPCYGIETLGRFAEPLRRVIDATAGFATIEAWHHEHGPGQFEINIAPQRLLEAADALFLLRTATREAAALAGSKLSWMAKPFSGLNGSACQINLSLWSVDGDTNLLADAADPLRLSVLARQFIAGLLEHLDELAAILLPNANSYRRVVPGHFAPLAKAWGVDNRTAALRVVVDTPRATRVEIRVGGADICAHLALPALVAAGLDGIRRSLDPGAPASGDLDIQDGGKLIDDWRTALECFERSPWAAAALSPELHRLCGQVKHQEYERWRRHVSDFERSEYFGLF